MLIGAGLLTSFQAEQLKPAAVTGSSSSASIAILDKLGAGGNAIVFLCEHKLMRRRVAVKVLPAAKAADPVSLQRFYREARSVAALDHPNIVHAYDIDHDEIVSLPGDGICRRQRSTRRRSRDTGRSAWPALHHFMRQTALGLDHAPPATVWSIATSSRATSWSTARAWSRSSTWILQLASSRDDEAILTNKFDDVLGTADYLAPEQAEDSHDVDIRADIYSLGATFYYVLTGEDAFRRGNGPAETDLASA